MPTFPIRIVFVSNLTPPSRCWSRVRAFRKLGAEVIELPSSADVDPETGNERLNVFQRAAAKFRIPFDWNGAGKRLLDVASTVRPDVVWLDKATMISPSVLVALKRLLPRTKLIWFSEDDMFAGHNRTWRFDRGLKHYDLVCTTKSYNLDERELPALGARRVAFFHQAYDAVQHYPPILSEEDRRALGAEVGFIGSYEEARAGSMYALAEAGVSVRVWGNGWERAHVAHNRLKIERRALVNMPGDLAYSKGIAATKINLCFLRKMNRDLHTSRSLEIPAIGGFMLAERTPEHEAMFLEGKEAAFFGSDEELIEKVKYYLDKAIVRQKIARSGHERCLRDHSALHQAELILGTLMELEATP
jgi:spore maturation protein CgeB